MNTLLKALALTAAWLVSSAVLAGEAVPVNATFGIQWTPVNWSNPYARVTQSLGAAGLANGKVLGIAARDRLDAVNGKITSDAVMITFSDTDWVYAEYQDIPAVYYPATNTASFFGPMKVVGGEGRFVGATGTLSIRSTIQFEPLPVGTLHIKGVIKTAN